jgi:hypothetical protein
MSANLLTDDMILAGITSALFVAWVAAHPTRGLKPTVGS